MKKLIALIMALTMVLGLCACGGSAAAPATEAPAAAAPEAPAAEAPADAAETPAAANDPKVNLVFTANASSADWHGKIGRAHV